MDFLFKDKQGNKCAAKTAFTMTMLTCLAKIAYSSFTGDAIDYNGMAVLIGSVGAIYFGRSHTKASQ